ncbi:MAG: transporter substrate-binding domain-containing protein [Idiomarina sp.]
MNARHLLYPIVFTFVLTACSPAQDAKTDPDPLDEKPQPTEVSAADEAVTDVSANCSLTMGFQAWEPYQYVSVGDEVSGLDVEIAEAVVEQMGCDLKAQQGTWRELLSKLRRGEVDFVLGASQTAARHEYAHFSEPYRQEQFVLFVRQNDIDSFAAANVTEFIKAGNKLGVVNEYYYGEDLREVLREGESNGLVVGAIISELNIARLLDGEIDAFLEDTLVAASILRRKGLENDIEQHEIELPASDVYVMFSQKSVPEEYVAAFNDALAEVKTNGTYETIRQRYGAEETALETEESGTN